MPFFKRPGPPSRVPNGFRSRSVPAVDTVPRITSITPSSVRVGTVQNVTITGFNFTAASDGTVPVVLVGGVPATSVVLVSSTQMTADFPSANDADSVDVTVQCGSQSGTAPGAYTYFTGVITGVSPSYGPLAGGTTVFISGLNFVTGSAITFGGVSAFSVTFIDSQNFSVVTPAHAIGFVDIEITDPLGGVIEGPHAFKYTLLTRGEDIRRAPGVQIRDVLNNTPNTCTFSIDGQSHPPYVGEEIQITDSLDGDRLLFAGVVQSFDQDYEGQTNQLVWKCNAVDFTFWLNRKRPYGAYEAISASDVVIDLIAKYAPGFTSQHVQTNLAKVSIVMDGTADFQTVLSNIAGLIGGGHWYVDYNRDLHFFHVSPNKLVPLPTTTVHLGPGTAMNVSQTVLIPSTYRFPPAFYFFQTTFLYDNGVESAYSPTTNPVVLDGYHEVAFASIPIGADAGTHHCIGRRIYFTYLGPIGGTHNMRSRQYFCDITDNTTTGFTTWWQSLGANSAAVVGPPAGKPRNYAITPPDYFPANVAPSAAVGTLSPFLPQIDLNFPQQLPRGPFTAGNYAFKISNIYQDLSESLPGPSTGLVALDGTLGAQLTGVPIGADINGVPVIARRVYASYGGLWDPSQSVSWWLIPNNTLTSVQVTPATAASIGTYFSHFAISQTTPPDSPVGSQVANLPVWPNPDGPNPEDADPPDDLTDDNIELLMAPQFTSNLDLSQVRNRVSVRGVGTSLTFAANVGDTSLYVTEMGFFAPIGGLVYINGYVLNYDGLEELTGPGQIFLTEAITTSFDQGTVVCFYLQANDTDSQEVLGKIELDGNGNPTDGVHETVISDSSLVNAFQLYMRAYAELELFANPITKIKYATRDPKTKSGAIVHIDLSNPPVKGDFLIQDVTIDQVHDESDQINPRYTATCSSVRFELQDLLLQIVNSSAPVASQAGVISAASDTAGGFNLKTKRWGTCGHALSTAGGNPTVQPASMGSGSFAGNTPVYDTVDVPLIGIAPTTATDFRWATFNTTASINNTSGIGGSWGITLESNIDWTITVRTGLNIANMIFWAGLGAGVSGSIPTSKNPSNVPLCCFRYSPTDGDQGWVGVLQPTGVGAKQYVTGPIAFVGTQSEYRLRIISSGGPLSSGVTVGFSVNDGPFTTVSVAQATLNGTTILMPVAGISGILTSFAGVVALENKVKKLSWRNWGFVLDN